MRTLGSCSRSIALIGLLLTGCAPAVCLVPYESSNLGFAVRYPCGWEVTDPSPCVNDPQGRPCSAVHFVSDLYAGDHQAFGKYTVIVAVYLAAGEETITDTVEYGLSPLPETMRDQLERRYLTIGVEPAIELASFPWERFGSRQIWVVHNELEYRLTFRPDMDFDSPSDAKARAAFDDFVSTFSFISVTETPTWLRPTITPVPTPTSVPSTSTSSAAG